MLPLMCVISIADVTADCLHRFTFKLSPGQETDEQLGLRSFFTLGPKEGIFVTPVLRREE